MRKLSGGVAERVGPFRPDAPGLTELAAGGVVYDRATGDVLILHVKEEDRWGFPKGHVEAGESVLAAARREIEEETTLSGLEFEHEVAEVHYRFFVPSQSVNVFKTVVYWKVRSASRDVRLEAGFDRFLWGSPRDLLGILTYETDRTVIHRFLDDALG
ncbi:MAG: NUDIX domain-containing protein [Thermoplasmata archaeon]|nr:NUDIX domain-containing protein [Thermoplasmata archaeon]